MRIAIDARFWGAKDTGLGIYTKNLVEVLLRLDKENEYVLFRKTPGFVLQGRTTAGRQNPKLKIQNSEEKIKVKIIDVDIRAYTMKEQILLPWILYKEKIDLVHFTSFNIPLLYSRPFVVTIHDLTMQKYRGTETTTRSPLAYWPKYWISKVVTWWAVKRSKYILVPSKTVKKELLKFYGLDKAKIVVAYGGIGEEFRTRSRAMRTKDWGESLRRDNLLLKSPFLLYVGNLYPHKNFGRLLLAFKKIKGRKNLKDKELVRSLKLVVVCGRDVFQRRFEEQVRREGLESEVFWTGLVDYEDLPGIYKSAEALVLPTLSEGFGFTGIEAMAVGCPVVCSDIEVLREVYGEAAYYFDPFDLEEMSTAILKVISDKRLRKALIEKGRKQEKKYSWDKAARRTLRAYFLAGIPRT